MSDQTAVIIAIVTLYSTGHWIGATILMAWIAFGIYQDMDDPLGIYRYLRDLRSYRE